MFPFLGKYALAATIAIVGTLVVLGNKLNYQSSAVVRVMPHGQSR